MMGTSVAGTLREVGVLEHECPSSLVGEVPPPSRSCTNQISLKFLIKPAQNAQICSRLLLAVYLYGLRKRDVFLGHVISGNNNRVCTFEGNLCNGKGHVVQTSVTRGGHVTSATSVTGMLRASSRTHTFFKETPKRRLLTEPTKGGFSATNCVLRAVRSKTKH